jgi:hypothetical protein
MEESRGGLVLEVSASRLMESAEVEELLQVGGGCARGRGVSGFLVVG